MPNNSKITFEQVIEWAEAQEGWGDALYKEKHLPRTGRLLLEQFNDNKQELLECIARYTRLRWRLRAFRDYLKDAIEEEQTERNILQ